MATKTSHLGLTKPAYTEKADVQAINENMDILDKEVAKRTNVKNLLDNSDFLPGCVVNQRGTASTTTNGDYIADRWIVNISNSAATVSIGSGGITLEPTSSNYVGIYQKLEHYAELSGKVYTMGVCINGVWEAATFTMANESSGKLLPCGLRVYSTGNTYQVMIRNLAGAAPVTIQCVALYEGSYTADTLPTYVVPDKQLEMIRCGVPLQPVNLLANSDFRNPVNQRGKTTYTGTGYGIDRWRTNYSGDTVEVLASGVRNTVASTQSGWHLHQILNNVAYLVGKNITAACYATAATGTLYLMISCRDSSDVEIGSGYKKITFGLCVASMTVPSGTAYIRVGIYAFSSSVSVGDAATLQWVALYEGNYTADTLPPYVPKGKKVEMINCGIPLQPVNLLDNSDFLNPVNQRGQTTYTGQGMYTIDRWKQAYNGSKVTVADSGLTITPGTSVQGWLRQYFEKPLPTGTQVSLYVELADGTIEVFPVSLPETTTYRQGKGYITGFNTTGIDLVVNVGDPAVTFRRVALYKGNYNRDTVPEYQPKEDVVELMQARTQLQPLMMGGQDQSFICEYVPENNYVQCQFTLSPPMRIPPSVFVAGGAMPRLVTYNAIGEVWVIPVTEISASNATPSTVLVKFATSVTLPTDFRMICVDAAGGNSVYASAEM